VTQNHRISNTKLVGRRAQQIGLHGGIDCGIARIVGPAQAGPVKGDDAVMGRKAAHQVKGEIAGVAAGAVDQHQIRARHLDMGVHGGAAHIQQLPRGRIGRARHRRTPVGPPVKQHAAPRNRQDRDQGNGSKGGKPHGGSICQVRPPGALRECRARLANGHPARACDQVPISRRSNGVV
jgi:hypothetical protein